MHPRHPKGSASASASARAASTEPAESKLLAIARSRPVELVLLVQDRGAARACRPSASRFPSRTRPHRDRATRRRSSRRREGDACSPTGSTRRAGPQVGQERDRDRHYPAVERHLLARTPAPPSEALVHACARAASAAIASCPTTRSRPQPRHAARGKRPFRQVGRPAVGPRPAPRRPNAPPPRRSARATCGRRPSMRRARSRARCTARDRALAEAAVFELGLDRVPRTVQRIGRPTRAERARRCRLDLDVRVRPADRPPLSVTGSLVVESHDIGHRPRLRQRSRAWRIRGA